MNIVPETKFPLTSEAVSQATGRTPAEWFALIDERLGTRPGRKAIGDLLFRELHLDSGWVSTLTVGYEAARGVVEKDGRPRGYAICVTRSLAATPEQVFAVVAAPTWAGPDTTVRVLKATPGKALRFTLEGADHPPGEVVEVKLAPSGDRCSVVLNHERIQDRGRADGCREAWRGILDTWQTRLA